jgi:hypothetical protein
MPCCLYVLKVHRASVPYALPAFVCQRPRLSWSAVFVFIRPGLSVYDDQRSGLLQHVLPRVMHACHRTPRIQPVFEYKRSSLSWSSIQPIFLIWKVQRVFEWLRSRDPACPCATYEFFLVRKGTGTRDYDSVLMVWSDRSWLERVSMWLPFCSCCASFKLNLLLDSFNLINHEDKIYVYV